LASCDKEEYQISTDCVEVSDNTEWITENFKTNYIIQFPDNYEGSGMIGFEGKVFAKNRIDNKIEFNYSFCKPTYCSDFGEALKMPIPNSIKVKDKANNEVILNSKKEFCLNGSLIGVFYFNSEMSSTGKLYMEQGSEYFNS
jgi:hypothetical protein